ncbi:hypothetical protein Psi02_43530 [Planotetraspora silvatica]|uniref:Uncharacterized protein n=1 Tax=Planotetraspora silvatica TaxID=234614 RepID=A0A8J3XNZ2_9ACTN|nr:hypothetical protein Psi02_43530 [Planotetraspora silvatica]
MAAVPEPSETFRDDDVSGGWPAGNVTVGFLPASPTTFRPAAAAVPAPVLGDAVFCAVPQAAASNKGKAAATIAVRRRM